MDRRDLDLAIRARESIAAGDAAATQPAEARLPPKAVESRDDLRKALAGTRWTWGNDRLQLMADGDVQMAEWTARGLVTRWRAVDRRTVLFVIARGRPNDRTAVLTFNEDLTGYDVTAGFEGNPYLGNRRLE